jgi:sialate O-acetylesterase
MPRPFLLATMLSVVVIFSSTANAEIRLPKVFGANMVLQRDIEIPVWGSAEAGEAVTVTIGKGTATTKADGDGRWNVKLPSMKAGGPHTVKISAASGSVTLEDVLIGEVWVCSGQSNMAFGVGNSDDADLELLSANFPNIRLISVPQVGTQEPQDDFGGEGWQACTPETAAGFSGVGFFFGRKLHQTLNVPIGLIDNAWGGSACEAWVSRDRLKAEGKYDELLARWADTEASFNPEAEQKKYQAQLENWKDRAAKAKDAGKPAPRRPRPPRNPLTGQHRPGNLYNGVLKPTIGYGIRGAIWYQGESNASRAYQYRDLFPLMISQWREEWGQGDFPFYFVQLADFRDEVEDPQESDWAELREAQTMTLRKLPNTGQAVITDLGEAHDIHPKDKLGVARRLVRWALAKDYGIDIAYRSPQYSSHEIKGNKVVVTINYPGSGMDTFDVRNPVGFAIAGEDKKFVWAQAKVVGKDQIEVWAEGISNPVSVRYAWADNPVCNVQSREGLPLTPFRTDDWPGVTIDVRK